MKSVLVVLAMLLSVEPAFAQAPATAQANEETHVGKAFWPGVMLAIAGSTVAILGGTALKSADYTSGNTPQRLRPAQGSESQDRVERRRRGGSGRHVDGHRVVAQPRRGRTAKRPLRVSQNFLVCCIRQIDRAPLVVSLSNHERLSGSSFDKLRTSVPSS